MMADNTNTSTSTTINNKRIKSLNLIQIAENAVEQHSNSCIEIGISFVKNVGLLSEFSKALPSNINDRFVKIGRSLKSLMTHMKEDGVELQTCLELLVEEIEILSLISKPSTSSPDSKKVVKVPKVRFGKTELQMPIITLGAMRFQQKWGDSIQTMDDGVQSDCQDNLLEILKHAFTLGITHIETAHGYGCSELQLGVALKYLFNIGYIRREDLIIQSKAGVNPNPQVFRRMIEQHFQRLQVDYLDLFAFHGLNGDWHWNWLFGENSDENGDLRTADNGETASKDGSGAKCCWDVIQEYKDAGKIKYVGFSTHGSPTLIAKLIKTNKFDYVNLHYHFCGSYTASCVGEDGTGNGNLECLKLMKERDMGAFVISGYDKGGKVYAPSRKLRSLTLPDLEPMAYASGWLWNHDKLVGTEGIPIHTFSVGAARAADLDQPAVAAYLQGKGELLSRVQRVSARLHQAKVDALGQEWVDTYHVGLIKSDQSKYLIEHNQIVWFYNCIKAFGLLQMCRDRYDNFTTSKNKWDDTKSIEENIDNRPRAAWGFMPGLPPTPGKDYFVDDLSGVPEANRERIREAYEFVLKWCPKDSTNTESPPKEWETTYEMKPWKDFPDR